MSKQKKSYDPKELYLRGLLAFGNYFQGLRWTKAGLNKQQQRNRVKFKLQGQARRAQRRAAHG